MVQVKEFKAPVGKDIKVFSDGGFHSAIIKDTWTPIREDLWRFAYGRGCISKDMMAKGFDKEQTLAAIKNDELNYESSVLLAMKEIISLGDPELLDVRGKPTVAAVGERVEKIPTRQLCNKLFKQLVD